MTKKLEPLYCSEKCKNKPVVRSFGVCPECNNVWDTSTPENTEHYRNNAWKFCKLCSIKLERCVVCGKNVKS